MKIQWINTYYPHGHWVDENGQSVTMPGSFLAMFEGEEIAVSMVGASTPAGHGEAAMTGTQPAFSNTATGDVLEIQGFIESVGQSIIPVNIQRGEIRIGEGRIVKDNHNGDMAIYWDGRWITDPEEFMTMVKKANSPCRKAMEGILRDLVEYNREHEE